jgi:hypothetical protein
MEQELIEIKQKYQVAETDLKYTSSLNQQL